MISTLKRQMAKLLDKADIRINGSRPWDVQVHNEKLYARVLKQGSLGLGEAYMDEWWDAGQPDEFFHRILAADINRIAFISVPFLWNYVKSFVTNRQKSSRAYHVGEQHYDIGNDLYELMLDPRMVYTCGYWDDTNELAQAQENKLHKVCETLGLQPGQRVLDVGCGWGSFAKYAAEEYDVSVVGVTVSREQKELAADRCKDLPVEIRLEDYRNLDESFDHVVSLGMFEHVGRKNYRTFMEVVHRCLAPDGKFVLHSIGGNVSVRNTDPWIEKYIFPNSMIPSIRQVGSAIEDIFVLQAWENHGPDYDKTVMAWLKNFTDHWDQLKANYSERFRRMWTYYLYCSAGSFRAHKNNQWHIVLAPRPKG